MMASSTGYFISVLFLCALATSIANGMTSLRSHSRDEMLYRKLRRTVATLPKQKRVLAEKPPGSLKLTERPPEEITAGSGESLLIECEFWGWPTPSSIFWLKDDMPVVQLKRMTHATLEPHETKLTSKARAEAGSELGTVRARLYLPCVSTQDAGLYTCIAESPLGKKAAAKTVLRVPDVNELPSQECDQKALELPPAVLLSRGVLGQGQGTSAVLLCRTAGGVVTWAGPNSEPLQSSKKYHVRSNGDLVIANLDFDDMGEYTCRVENDAGFDEVTTFVYPFSNEDGNGSGGVQGPLRR